MPVDPILQPFLGQPGPPLSALNDPVALRAEAEAGTEALFPLAIEPAPDVAEVNDVRIPVTGGEIGARIYRPEGSTEPLPVHLFFHGGGWTILSAFSRGWDNFAQERAALSGHLVVSVDYRKGPEHKFPTAVDDGYAALRWVTENAARFGGDPNTTSVGGVSSGANIAAAIALKARDLRGPTVSFQLLEVPALDLRRTNPLQSRTEYAEGYMLTTEELILSLTSYLTSDSDALHPYASPLLADDLSGLPAAYIMSAEYDIVADDGPAYAAKLTAAGVPAVFRLGEGQTHVSSAFTKISPAARAWRDAANLALRESVRTLD